jgi:AcrR family transcriptional regulator
MGYRHSRDEILRAATAVALEFGLARLTFAAVARYLGTSDRMVVYYFPTKAALVTAVIQQFGSGLRHLLESAFGVTPLDVHDLVRQAWPVLTTPAADRIFARYFELVGLAAAGQAPFDGVAQDLLLGWVEWLTPRTRGDDDATRRGGALAAIAQLDGLLLLRHLLGAPMADQAARAAGVLGEESSRLAPDQRQLD